MSWFRRRLNQYLLTRVRRLNLWTTVTTLDQIFILVPSLYSTKNLTSPFVRQSTVHSTSFDWDVTSPFLNQSTVHSTSLGPYVPFVRLSNVGNWISVSVLEWDVFKSRTPWLHIFIFVPSSYFTSSLRPYVPVREAIHNRKLNQCLLTGVTSHEHYSTVAAWGLISLLILFW